jgi:hypothetical protein
MTWKVNRALILVVTSSTRETHRKRRGYDPSFSSAISSVSNGDHHREHLGYRRNRLRSFSVSSNQTKGMISLGTWAVQPVGPFGLSHGSP